MASTAGSVAVGSVVGHGLSNMLFGGGSSSAAAVPEAPVQQQSYQERTMGGACEIQAKDFTQCLSATGNDMGACGFYLEALKVSSLPRSASLGWLSRLVCDLVVWAEESADSLFRLFVPRSPARPPPRLTKPTSAGTASEGVSYCLGRVTALQSVSVIPYYLKVQSITERVRAGTGDGEGASGTCESERGGVARLAVEGSARADGGSPVDTFAAAATLATAYAYISTNVQHACTVRARHDLLAPCDRSAARFVREGAGALSAVQPGSGIAPGRVRGSRGVVTPRSPGREAG